MSDDSDLSDNSSDENFNNLDDFDDICNVDFDGPQVRYNLETSINGLPQFNPIKYAIKKGPIQYAERLLKQEKYLLHKLGNSDKKEQNKQFIDQLNGSIRYAIARKSKPLVELLKKYGADLNAHFDNRHEFLIKHIIDDCFHYDNEGYPEDFYANFAIKRFQFAAEMGLNLKNWFSFANQYNHFIDESVRLFTDYPEILHFIISAGVNIDHINDNNDTLLMYWHDNTNIRHIIKHSDLAIRNKNDETVLTKWVKQLSCSCKKTLTCSKHKNILKICEWSTDQNFEKAIKLLGKNKCSIITKSTGYNRYLLKQFVSEGYYGSTIPRDIANIIEKFLINQ